MTALIVCGEVMTEQYQSRAPTHWHHSSITGPRYPSITNAVHEYRLQQLGRECLIWRWTSHINSVSAKSSFEKPHSCTSRVITSIGLPYLQAQVATSLENTVVTTTTIPWVHRLAWIPRCLAKVTTTTTFIPWVHRPAWILRCGIRSQP